MISNRREASIRMLAFALASAVALSLLASSNSPLFDQYRFDYAIYKVMGNGWARGLIPFRDLFDHKGPVIFFIQLLASLVSKSKVVIWLLEVAVMTVTCEMLYRCGRYIGTPKGLDYLSIMIVLLVYGCFVDGGNTIETWSLPFEVLPLLLLLRSLWSRTKLTTTAFVGGVCFGIVAMTRINGNAMIAGLVIGMVIYLCREREYSRILSCAGWFLSGMVIPIALFVIYFWSVGAFDDFIYCSFTYNMQYMGNPGVSKLEAFSHNLKLMFPCVIFLPVLCLYSRKRGIKLLTVLAPAALITILTFGFGRNYPHYFLMTLPFAALSIQMLWTLGRLAKVSVFFMYFLSCGYILRVLAPFRIGNIIEMRKAEYPGVTGQQFISDFIPDGEKGSIYVYGDMDPSAAVDANGYSPAGKYFFNQDIIQSIDPWAHDDIIAKFREANPKWVIVASETISPLEGCMSGYKEVAGDSLPPSCPETWHVYIRK